ncbi:MAG: GxxExxY protein [Verrucomicrobiota bacterium]
MINRLTRPNENDEALAKRIIGLAMKVHRALGCGFLESVYVSALKIELTEAGISFEHEKRYAVFYKEIEIGFFHADLVAEGRLIIEVKAVEGLAVAHSVQLVNYLAVSKIDLGLLLNFAPRSLEFKTKTRVYAGMPEPPDLHS